MKHVRTLNSVYSKGSLLLELLIVIALLALILSVGAQGVYVSLQSSKVSGERDTASALATEGLEAVRGVVEEKWQTCFHIMILQHHRIFCLFCQKKTRQLRHLSGLIYCLIQL